MKAKVTKAFIGRPGHEDVERTIKVGETIDGDFAVVAVRDGHATAIKPAQPVKPTKRKR